MVVACEVGFTTTVTEQGDMWTFSAGMHGVLGLGTDTDQQVPACVQENDKVFGTVIIQLCVTSITSNTQLNNAT